MRIYIAGVQHESSSFSPIPTSYRSFLREMWSAEEPSGCHGFGYGEACVLAADAGMDIVAGPFFNAQPSLPCTTAAWERVSGEILDALAVAMPVDIVFLCLHGAQMTDQLDDAEGNLLTRVRSLVGDDVPVAALLDLHANVTPTMIEQGDLIVSCREYPHTDKEGFATRTIGHAGTALICPAVFWMIEQMRQRAGEASLKRRS